VRLYFNPELIKNKMSGVTRERLSLELKSLVDDMKIIFGTKVKAIGNESKGRIYIDYYTRDDLQRFFDLIEALKTENRK
jgi:hypothetical protein